MRSSTIFGSIGVVLLLTGCVTPSKPPDGGDIVPLADAGVEAGKSPPGLSRCEAVIPDEEIHCPYHPLRDGDDLVYLDLRDGTIRTSSVSRPGEAEGATVFDPFPNLGWGPGPATISPDGERALVARRKDGCNELDCSLGRLTIWAAQHLKNDPANPDDDTWMHVNLARRGLGRNSEAHGWSTWLHEDRALFNALVRGDHEGWPSTQEENTAQAYSVRFTAQGPVVEPYAPDQLWRDDCLSGRLNAQPSTAVGQCFDGQRVTMVRRCYGERKEVSAWAWWNTAKADGGGGKCLAGMPSFEVPVLRTYVLELDASCTPKRPFEQLVPVRKPLDSPVYRQMGAVAEWGDMLSAISPDGRCVAFAANMGNPGTPDDNCAGFKLNLFDPSNPLSGAATRRTTVCELDETLRCKGEGLLLGAELTPPEGTPLPTFVELADGGMSIAHTREWGIAGAPGIRDVIRVDFLQGADARVPLQFAQKAVAGQGLYKRR